VNFAVTAVDEYVTVYEPITEENVPLTEVALPMTLYVDPTVGEPTVFTLSPDPPSFPS
jgi:hypothetical protein